jgi:hypothetical protein
MLVPKSTPCPEFLSTSPQPLKYLINQLIPAATLVLLHGDPRTKKSYTALELAIACATGLAAFGLSRFLAPKRIRVLYLSQEDPAHVVRERIRAILADKCLDPPENLSVGIHQGINLDSDISRNYLRSIVKGECYQLLFVDPIRRFTSNADKGPSEVTPITTFLRKLCVELDVTTGIIHHNTKPPAINGSGRKDSYNASGGDWFASCECPISFQSNGDSWTHVIPQNYKLSASPDPFDVQVTEDEETGRIHLEARESRNVEREDRIIVFLASTPDQSENSIAAACKMKRSALRPILASCEAKGSLIQHLGPRNSHLWSLPSSN